MGEGIGLSRCGIGSGKTGFALLPQRLRPALLPLPQAEGLLHALVVGFEEPAVT